MGLKQDIAGTEVYMARATRRIGKARHLIGRSPNGQTVATAGELVEVLTALLANVEAPSRNANSPDVAPALP